MLSQKLLASVRLGFTIGKWSFLGKLFLVGWQYVELRLPKRLQKLWKRK